MGAAVLDNGVPLAVAYHHGHQHQIYSGAKGERRVALGHLGGLRLLLAHTAGNGQYQQEGGAETHDYGITTELFRADITLPAESLTTSRTM